MWRRFYPAFLQEIKHFLEKNAEKIRWTKEHRIAFWMTRWGLKPSVIVRRRNVTILIFKEIVYVIEAIHSLDFFKELCAKCQRCL